MMRIFSRSVRFVIFFICYIVLSYYVYNITHQLTKVKYYFTFFYFFFCRKMLTVKDLWHKRRGRLARKSLTVRGLEVVH